MTYLVDKIKMELLQTDNLISDFSPIRTIFAHNKQLIDVSIPENNNNLFFTAAKDNTLICWYLNSGQISKKYVFEKKLTCFTSVRKIW
jgi:WD40 repeat protein